MDFLNLTFAELKAAREELDHVIEQRRLEALERMRAEATAMGLTMDAVLQNGHVKPKYVNPDDPGQVYFGKGRKPVWLQEKLDAGANLNDFAVA